MKKKYFTIGFIIILLLLSSTVLLGINNSYVVKEDVALRNLIIETVQRSNEIDFTELTNFEWDTMYIFTPYTNPKDILEEDNITAYHSKFNIEINDTINMIGFVKANKLVQFVELPRIYGGMDLTNPIKFSKEESKFNILQDKEGILFNKN